MEKADGENYKENHSSCRKVTIVILSYPKLYSFVILSGQALEIKSAFTANLAEFYLGSQYIRR
jgi:hypothetical protein